MKTVLTAALLVIVNLVGVQLLVRHYAQEQRAGLTAIVDRMDGFQSAEVRGERQALDKAVQQSSALLLGQAEGAERQAQLIKKLDAVLARLAVPPRKPPPKKPWWRFFW